MKTLVYETPMERQQDLVARIQVAVGVIRDMPGILPRVRYDMTRRCTKCIEVGGSHLKHLLFKMLFTYIILIAFFTSFLAFVIGTAYVLLHISETLARILTETHSINILMFHSTCSPISVAVFGRKNLSQVTSVLAIALPLSTAPFVVLTDKQKYNGYGMNGTVNCLSYNIVLLTALHFIDERFRHTMPSSDLEKLSFIHT
ncbi:hypothetical protein ANN_22300 [Periplaneta americana]|uniref:Uncharacterized protein n=1 Tax=Periplaneta americana TaxID=6978 RepID=A0ABQ8S7U4_PERAM|nr:hypothetical protein ANN_22300 [Periplaneta americana]